MKADPIATLRRVAEAGRGGKRAALERGDDCIRTPWWVFCEDDELGDMHDAIGALLAAEQDEGFREHVIALLRFVVEKYDVKSVDEFTCEHHRALAIDVGWDALASDAPADEPSPPKKLAKDGPFWPVDDAAPAEGGETFEDAMEQALEYARSGESCDHDASHVRHFCEMARIWIERAQDLASPPSPQDGLREALEELAKRWEGASTPDGASDWNEGRADGYALCARGLREALAANPPAAGDVEPERPKGIPAPTFKSRRPEEDLHGWLSQRITYVSSVEAKMPDADRRYLAKCWVRDLKQALSVLDKQALVASPTPSDTAIHEALDDMLAEINAVHDGELPSWGSSELSRVWVVGRIEAIKALASAPSDTGLRERFEERVRTLEASAREGDRMEGVRETPGLQRWAASVIRSVLAADDGGKSE